MTTVVALYNIKGGVGKTSASVNLAWLAAVGRRADAAVGPRSAGRRDVPAADQAEGQGRRAQARRRQDATSASQLKGTDHELLDLLPADFSYRNMDLELDDVKRPTKGLARVLARGRGRLRVRLPGLPAGDLAGVGEHLRRGRRPARPADPVAAVAADVRSAARVRRERGDQAAADPRVLLDGRRAQAAAPRGHRRAVGRARGRAVGGDPGGDGRRAHGGAPPRARADARRAGAPRSRTTRCGRELRDRL